ncbi:hypothetical protein C0J52_14141, partial [Blattella germanica]
FESCKSIITVQRAFRRQFNCEPPNANNICRWHNQPATTGCLCKGNSVGRPRVQRVWDAFVHSPKKSVRKASREFAMPVMTVWKVLRKRLHMRPYRLQLVSKYRQSDHVPGVYANDSAGLQLIIVHAGWEMEFISCACLIYDSKSKTTDYHNMNYENYSKWVQHQLIPGLPERSIVVIDNTPCHNKQDNKIPSTNSLKSEIQEWLWNDNIPFDPEMTKAELLISAKQYRPKKTYSIDKLYADAGFTILRLPLYCQT